jgi:hypothetical protein
MKSNPDTRPKIKDELEDLPGKPQWIDVEWADCDFCGDTVQAETKAGNFGYFYDCDQVRCIGECGKIVGRISGDDTAHVIFDEDEPAEEPQRCKHGVSAVDRCWECDPNIGQVKPEGEL